VPKVIRIERKELRPGRTKLDEAHRDQLGEYVLAAPDFSSKERKQTKNATKVTTLDEVADLICKNRYHIRMGNPPEYPSLIEPDRSASSEIPDST
jgi:hypothetical protein